jgi:hypothetical protein
MEEEIKNFGASWWQKMITRREANKELAKIGALAVLMASVGINSGCDSDEDDDTEVQQDAMELQKKEGWNIGSTDKNLDYPYASTMDSTGSLDWTTYLDPNNLLKAYQPVQPSLQPYVVPTLVQVLSQPTFKGKIAPLITNKMQEAYSRGLGMRELVKKSKNMANTILISDLTGPESVAFAAALSDVAEPIMTFDNWPHPLGVVKSHHTLAALLYYAKEVSQKAEDRKTPCPAIMMLDRNRLSSYSDADNQFDNRYVAKLPTSDNLKTLNVTGVLYYVPDEQNKAELDDINDDFATFQEKGISVSMIPLTDFKPDPAATTSAPPPAGTTTTTGNVTNVYHYGGGTSFWPYFFMYHAFMRPAYGIPSYSTLPPSTISRSTYAPARRPTMFSSSSVGGVKGVGRTKPSGFGRVSTRVGTNGRVSGVRAGRSGSFGRSSGRGG